MIKYQRPYWLTKELRFLFLIVPVGIGVVLSSLYNSQHAAREQTGKGRPLTHEEWERVRNRQGMGNIDEHERQGEQHIDLPNVKNNDNDTMDITSTQESLQRLPSEVQYWWYDRHRRHSHDPTSTHIIGVDAEYILNMAAKEKSNGQSR
eukprot:gb/GECH01012881.1/.p1 GENE.gb/GECH01012881.1/~~gb/GECH01012881.1/.p1  ORF type:complete len:149 (+),score=16.87 gb/GECH01012881.1/:1-447(+)